MLKGERQMKPLEAVQIATFLGVPQDEVLRHAGDEAVPPPTGRRARPGRGRPPSASASGVAARRRHDPDPQRRRAAAAIRRCFSKTGRSATRRGPANLGGVRAAYAIYMVGDSMEPRYEQGWLLHVNPFKPPTRGRDVVVYKQGQAC